MSSDQRAVVVDGLGKRYHIYDSPTDRLKQFLLPRLRSLTGRAPMHSLCREFWAIRDISFEVATGESFGIIGRNGCGKSTLLQLIAGTLTPTEGRVATRGRIAALLELGSGFNPEFNGRENVYLNAAILGLSREEIDERFDRIAAFADIGDYLDQPVKTYSSGMLVRLAFAVQVQVGPDILIVDEALAVGDALFQKRCFQRLEQLLSNGVTLLFVSHDQESIRSLTRRAILLRLGRAEIVGSSASVLLAYRKQLHAEESDYFSKLAAVGNPANADLMAANRRGDGAADPEPAGTDGMPRPGTRSDLMTFGDGGVQVVRVQTLDGDEQACSIFYPGQPLIIRLTCRTSVTIGQLNVGIRIRSKEGIKIYSWGTLNQDMYHLACNRGEPLFWNRRFQAGETFVVTLYCEHCPLGVNLYEVQASVSYEGRPDYTEQRMLHWLDEAAFFQVLMKTDEYFFGGGVDLRMSASWLEGTTN